MKTYPNILFFLIFISILFNNSCAKKQDKEPKNEVSTRITCDALKQLPEKEVPNALLIQSKVAKYSDFLELAFTDGQGLVKKYNNDKKEEEQVAEEVKENLVQDKKVNVKVDIEVFGFHPYYGKSDAYEDYNYKVLTSLSYFAYDLNPKTGDYKSIRDWKTTPVIDLAKKNNCKIYLTVTNFGDTNNKIFLNNKNAQDTSIKKIANLLMIRQANGVTIDFEEVSGNLKEKFTEYVKNLATRLKQDGMTVNLTLPPIDYKDAYDIKTLDEYVEFFIVMGKNFYGKGNTIAGPVAPLNKGEHWTVGSLKTSIDKYNANGLKNDKLILSLPYYGSQWTVKDTIMGSNNAKFEKHLSYKTIKNEYSGEPTLYDNESKSAYIILSESDKHEIIWFDDAKSLGEKYQYIIDEKLAGVGIWALGYDGNHPELWNALSDKFVVNKQIINTQEDASTVADTSEQFLSWLKFIPNVNVLKVFVYIICIIFLLGFLVSLRNHEIREIVFQNVWLKNLILLGLPLLILILFFAEKQFVYGLIIFVSLILGYFIYHFYVRTEQIHKSQNRIP